MLKGLVYTFISLILAVGCTSVDTDKISDDLTHQPDLSVPLGKITGAYEAIDELPVDLPDPIDSEPISWTEQETVYFDLGESRENILSMTLQFDIINRFPAETAITLSFMNIGEYVTTLRFEPIIVKAAEIDEEGKITSQKVSDPYPYRIRLKDEYIDDIFNAEYLIIKAEVNNLVLTTPIVNSINEYSFNAAVGVQAKLNYQTDDT